MMLHRAIPLSSLLSLAVVGCAIAPDPEPEVPMPPPGGGGGGGNDVPTTPDDPGPPAGTCAPVELHVVGVYEVEGDHSFQQHPMHDGAVRIERPGRHALVLSAYEPVTWHVSTAPGAVIDRVVAVGYYAPVVVGVAPGTPVSILSPEQGGAFACGYSWPYNGQGCDTNQLLALAASTTGLPLTSFHGCYQASTWTLRADRSATSDCATDQGYEPYELLGSCTSMPPPSTGWVQTDFQTATPTACSGARYVRYVADYDKWVGAVLCGSARRYKLFMAEQRTDVFVEIADYAGHGQDHCELVSDTFTLPDEDDITSGGCTDCALAGVDDLDGVPAYARNVFGEDFTRVTTGFWGDLSTPWYECGVAIP